MTRRRIRQHQLAQARQRRPEAAPPEVAEGRTTGPLALQEAAGNQAALRVLRDETAQNAALLHAGVEHAAAALAVARQPRRTTEQRLEELEHRVNALQNQETAMATLMEFQNQVLARAESWMNAAIRIGSAYSTAARRHKEACEADAKARAAENDLMFAVLGMATAGSFNWLVSMMRPERELLTTELHQAAEGGVTRILRPGAPIVEPPAPAGPMSFPTPGPLSIPTPHVGEAVEHAAEGFEYIEAFKKGVETVQDKAKEAAKEGGGGEPIQTDPLVFQNSRVSQITQDKQNAYTYFAQLASQLRTAHAGLLASDAQLPGEDSMADELERGIWAKWAEEQVPHNVYGAMTTVTVQLGDATSARLRALGIKERAGLELTGFEWFTHGHLFDDSNNEDVFRLRAWAKDFRPQQFMPGGAPSPSD